MSVHSLIQALGERLRNRKVEIEVSNQQRYRQILEAINRGESISDFEEVEAVLEALGKSPDAMATDAETLLRRQEWRALLDQLPKHETAQKKAADQIAKLATERDEYVKQINERITGIYEIQKAAEQAIALAEDARSRLVGSCTDAHLLNREAELTEIGRENLGELRAYEDDLRELDRQIRACQVTIESCQARIEKSPHSPLVADERAEIAAAQRQLEHWQMRRKAPQARVDELRAAGAERQRELDEIRQQKLNP